VNYKSRLMLRCILKNLEYGLIGMISWVMMLINLSKINISGLSSVNNKTFNQYKNMYNYVNNLIPYH
jgi:hypothetical protein